MVEWLAGNRVRGTNSERINGTSGISLDGSPQTNTGTTATSLSVSINVGDNNNKALIVCVTQQSGSTTSVKVGSNSFTNVDIQNGGNAGNGTQRTEIWYLLDDDITNNASNQIDWVGSAGSRVSIGVYSLYNVDQTVSGNFVSSSAYGTASTTTGVVNSVGSDDFILDILSANSSTQPVDTLTEGWNVQIVTNRYSTSQYNSSPSTNNDMFYSNVTGAEWAWSGVRIKPIPAVPAMVEIPAVSGGWKELGRTTLGSSGDSIDVSSFADKRYLMLLASEKATGGEAYISWRFNSDTGNNYGFRYNTNGGTDATGQDDRLLSYPPTNDKWSFVINHIANKSDKEKLNIIHTVTESASGAGTAPQRREIVGKWANTSAPITTVSAVNTGSGDYDSGAEVVVLGWDPDDTHTDNFWEELASTTLTSAGDTLSSGTFTAKKYLWVQGYTFGTSGNEAALRVGNNSVDTSSNYTYRYSSNGGSDGTEINKTKLIDLSNQTPIFWNYFIINIATKEKLMIGNMSRQSTAGAGNAPSRMESVEKWTNTSNQINIIDFQNTGAGGDMSIGSTIKVWGHD